MAYSSTDLSPVNPCRGRLIMIGMNFCAFLVLLVAGVVAGVIHSVTRYRFLKGSDGFWGDWLENMMIANKSISWWARGR